MLQRLPCEKVFRTADRGIPADGIGGYRIQNREPYGLELSLLASIVLGGSAIPRAIRLRKPVPMLLSVLSVFGLVTFGKAYQQKL